MPTVFSEAIRCPKCGAFVAERLDDTVVILGRYHNYVVHGGTISTTCSRKNCGHTFSFGLTDSGTIKEWAGQTASH